MDYDTCYIAMLRWVHFSSIYGMRRITFWVSPLALLVASTQNIILRNPYILLGLKVRAGRIREISSRRSKKKKEYVS